ncbi:MAG: YafY family transcriptional regulator [Pelagimonas sp.]|jgi:predicted DNA-binding transcriptional regulator YafY|nr:YafY family transcriptional regulator [Pelagimonas sp.]
MNRKDRLYALMQRLRDGQLHTAESMAQDLRVSVRTIYRDMETLAASGVPVEGARGYGYSVQEAITLPPLNLTPEELESLHVALATLSTSGDPELSPAAQSLAAKVQAVLPADSETAKISFGFATDAAKGFAHIPTLRSAIRAKQRLRAATPTATHDLRPLHLDYWGRVWTVLGWSETKSAFTTLRVDHITQLTPLPGLFVDEPGKTLDDWRTPPSH